MNSYAQAAATIRAPLPEKPSLADFVRLATLAPNSHNTQPWSFRLGDNFVEIMPDLSRRCPVVDPDDHHLFVSLGCAAENLAVAANACGRPAEISVHERSAGQIGVRVTLGSGARKDVELCKAITERQSTRSTFDGKPLSGEELQALKDAAAMQGVDVVFLTGRAEMERALILILEANRMQICDAAFVGELMRWLRFNPAAALKMRDGLFSGCTGNPNLPNWLAPIVFGLVFKEGPENRKLAEQVRSSAGLAIFVAAEESPEGWVAVGRSFERFALEGTRLGVRHAHVNMPIEVAAVRPRFAETLGMPGRRPDLVIRFGKAAPMPMSLRRPVNDILDVG